jgi:hypothetical protein
MPSLKIFGGRRTVIGGDDLQPGAVGTIFVRVLQILVLLTPILVGIGKLIQSCGWDTYGHLSTPNNSNDSNSGAEGSSFCAQRDYHKNYPLWLLGYQTSSLLYCLTSIVTELALVRASSLGTPTEPHGRNQRVRKILEMKLVALNLINAAILAVGIYTANAVRLYYICHSLHNNDDDNNDINADNYNFENDEYEYWFASDVDDATSGGNGNTNSLNTQFPRSWWFCLSMLLLCQAMEVLMGLLSICVVCRLPKASGASTPSASGLLHNDPSSTVLDGSSPRTEHNLHHESYYGPMEELWQTRCRTCCKVSGLLTCYLFGGRDLHTTGDFTQIATILTDYLEDGGGILDIVASDVVMGFMLLWRIQTQRQVQARQRLLEQVSFSTRNRIASSNNNNNSNSIHSLATHMLQHNSSSGSYEMLIDLRSGDALNLVSSTSTGSTLFANASQGDGSASAGISASASDDLSITSKQQHHRPEPLLDVVLEDEDGSATRTSDIPTTNVATARTGPPREEALVYVTRRNGITGGIGSIPQSQTSQNSMDYDCSFREVLSDQDNFDCQIMAEGARFARHALAIYSWKLYTYMYPHKALFTLAKWRCRRIRARPDRGPLVGDTTWHLHESCVLEHVGLLDKSARGSSNTKAPPCELVYGRFDNGLLETPYGVLLDHAWNSVVITIRGSLSLEDCVIDVLCDPESLQNLGEKFGFDGQGEYCHSGVVNRSEWLYQDLERYVRSRPGVFQTWRLNYATLLPSLDLCALHYQLLLY